MEQLYMIELYVDRIKIYAREDELDADSRNKELRVRINFGWPKKQLLIREHLIVKNNVEDELVKKGEKSSWIRSVRSGTAFLFVTFPDTLLTMLRTSPLEIEVWNNDQNESSDDFKKEIFVGIGKLIWDRHFIDAVKANSDCPRTGEIQPPTIKTVVKIAAECCCKTVGEVKIIIRLSPLGPMVITDFQQNLSDPEYFNFKTDKYPGNIYKVNISDDIDNPLYGYAVANDPVLGDYVDKRTEICTVLPEENPDDDPCDRHRYYIERDHRIKIGKIKIGDIIGPCGNPHCKLARKIKAYVRNLEAYKKITGGFEKEVKNANPRKICGKCICRNDKWYSQKTKPIPKEDKCEGCGGKAPKGQTCKQQDDQFFSTGATPPGGSIAEVNPAAKNPN